MTKSEDPLKEGEVRETAGLAESKHPCCEMTMWSTWQNCGQTPGAESGCWPTAREKTGTSFLEPQEQNSDNKPQ